MEQTKSEETRPRDGQRFCFLQQEFTDPTPLEKEGTLPSWSRLSVRKHELLLTI